MQAWQLASLRQNFFRPLQSGHFSQPCSFTLLWISIPGKSDVWRACERCTVEAWVNTSITVTDEDFLEGSTLINPTQVLTVDHLLLLLLELVDHFIFGKRFHFAVLVIVCEETSIFHEEAGISTTVDGNCQRKKTPNPARRWLAGIGINWVLERKKKVLIFHLFHLWSSRIRI